MTVKERLKEWAAKNDIPFEKLEFFAGSLGIEWRNVNWIKVFELIQLLLAIFRPDPSPQQLPTTSSAQTKTAR